MRKMVEVALKTLRMGKLEEEVLQKILRDPLGKLDTEFISSNKQIVAETFDALLIGVQLRYGKVENIPATIMEEIFMLFQNIEHMGMPEEKEEKSNDGICLVYFLSFLKQHNQIEGDNDFSDLSDVQSMLGIIAEDLENIRFIFDYQIDGKYVFPIDQLLVGLIKNSNFLQKKNGIDRRDYYALKLAVRFFRKHSEGDQIISDIQEKCNLKFIDYLKTECILIDTEEMLNYQKNGVMIFWDSQNKKALIRSNNKGYFNVEGVENKEVKCETTIDKMNEIGYFVEIQYKHTDQEKKVAFLMKEFDRREDILRLFFTEGRNIFLPYAVFESEDHTLHLVNPYSKSDRYIIKDNKFIQISEVQKAFQEYANIVMKASRENRMNQVCIGTFILLCEIEEDHWEDLLGTYDNNVLYQNEMIQRWMKKASSSAKQKMIVEYYHDLSYCNSTESIKKHVVRQQSFYPIKNSVTSLYNCLSTPVQENQEVIIFKGFYSDDTQDITLSSLNKRVPIQEVIDSEHILETMTGSILYFIYADEKIYVSDQETTKALFGLNEIFRYCIDFETIKKISSISYENMVETMALHKIALTEGAQRGFPKGDDFFIDQAYYRLIHNIAGYDVNADKIDDYIKIINTHERMNFSEIQNDSVFHMDQLNVLYIPKDKPASDAAFDSIFHHYLKKQSTRDEFILYTPHLECNKGLYFRDGIKIEKIVLLLDNILSGTATIHRIAAYFDFSDDEKIEGITKRNLLDAKMGIQQYRCADGKEVTIKEIQDKNNCKFEVHAYYGTEKGRSKVDEFLKSNDIIYNPTTYCREIRTVVSDIKDSLVKVWPEYNASDESYAVIREFNMPKQNVFPSEMIDDAQRAITLFIKKHEKQNPQKTEKFSELSNNIDTIINYIFEEKEGEEEGKYFYELYDVAATVSRAKEVIKGRINYEDEKTRETIVELCITGLVKYFLCTKLGCNEKSNNSLTVVSTLPPEIRINVWEKVIQGNHSLIVLEKLVKAYAKNDQEDKAYELLERFKHAGLITEEEDERFAEAVKLLSSQKTKLPIATSMSVSRKNYMAVMQAINRDNDIDQEFVTIMDVLNTIGEEGKLV